MTAPLTAGGLYTALRRRLGLRWLAGRTGEERPIGVEGDLESAALLVGPLNFISPSRIQILGTRELRYLASLGRNSRADAVGRLFGEAAAVVILADGEQPPEDLVEAAERHGTPLLGSRLAAQQLVGNLRYYLSHLLSKKVTLHGVFMEVMGIGVLITGEAAVGKSELALELITRGHRLIADDAPEFARVAPDVLSGTCPEVLRDFLEVRGLGVLNIRAMYGDRAIKRTKYLRLIVRLAALDDPRVQAAGRLESSRRTRRILGVQVPEITIPVAPGRNIAVLVEAAVQDQILRSEGYDAAKAFAARQRRAIEEQERRGEGA